MISSILEEEEVCCSNLAIECKYIEAVCRTTFSFQVRLYIIFCQVLLAAVDVRPWESPAKRRVQHYGYEFLYEIECLNLMHVACYNFSIIDLGNVILVVSKFLIL